MSQRSRFASLLVYGLIAQSGVHAQAAMADTREVLPLTSQLLTAILGYRKTLDAAVPEQNAVRTTAAESEVKHMNCMMTTMATPEAQRIHELVTHAKTVEEMTATTEALEAFYAKKCAG